MNASESLAARLIRFPRKSWGEKVSTISARWHRVFPGVPLPVRLPEGLWWLLDRDFIGASLADGGYENAERRFAERILLPGMTVLDIGAHRGFHSLLFSKKVGARGRVIAFEPSPQEAKRLRMNLRMNRCTNVQVKQFALGEKDDASVTLYVVEENGVLNSLRPRDQVPKNSPTCVALRKLDNVLSEMQIDRVDFVKLDVEGGELNVLRGATRLFERLPRPTVLCEVLEETTRLWKYPAREIIQFLAERHYRWFGLGNSGDLEPVRPDCHEYRGNFVAVPEESLAIVSQLRRPHEHVALRT